MRAWGWLLVLLSCLQSGALSQEQPLLRWSKTWYVAEIGGRSLWMREQSVAVYITPSTQLQLGWQWIHAKGKVRTNRFDTSARWFGIVQAVGSSGDTQRLLEWRRLEGEEGVADVAEGRFTYVAPRVEHLSLHIYRQSERRAPRYQIGYSRLRAGTESARSWSLRWQSQVSESPSLYLSASLHADNHQGTAYRSVLSATFKQPFGKSAWLRFGATLAPAGFPLVSTEVEALTAFAVYRPGGLVETWRNRAAGFVYLQIETELR